MNIKHAWLCAFLYPPLCPKNINILRTLITGWCLSVLGWELDEYDRHKSTPDPKSVEHRPRTKAKNQLHLYPVHLNNLLKPELSVKNFWKFTVGIGTSCAAKDQVKASRTM